MKIIRLAPIALALVAVIAAATPATRAHFGLSKSLPEAGTTVTSPDEVRLWFTQEPQEGTVQIRVVEAEDAGVHVMDPVQDEEDGRVFSIVLHGTLPPATYTVSWRGMSADGHVVRETFPFTVTAQ